MGIDRYDLYVDEYEDEPDLHYHECGDWVRFEDHEQVVAELTKLADGLSNALQDASLELVRLRAELAEKSKDAERYQWLRKIENRRGLDAGESLDRYIDTAMGEGNGR